MPKRLFRYKKKPFWHNEKAFFTYQKRLFHISEKAFSDEYYNTFIIIITILSILSLQYFRYYTFKHRRKVFQASEKNVLTTAEKLFPAQPKNFPFKRLVNYK